MKVPNRQVPDVNHMEWEVIGMAKKPNVNEDKKKLLPTIDNSKKSEEKRKKNKKIAPALRADA
jgi:hypothetical protein